MGYPRDANVLTNTKDCVQHHVTSALAAGAPRLAGGMLGSVRVKRAGALVVLCAACAACWLLGGEAAGALVTRRAL